MRRPKPTQFISASFALLLFTLGGFSTAQAAGRCSVDAFEFTWRGQIAGFIVNGRFSYNGADVPDNGIIREEDLLALDISFYDPQGNLLRTYYDNQDGPTDENGVPYLNFAFDTLTKQLMQDGTFNVDDDDVRFRNGFTMGAGDPAKRSMPGSQTGLAFWSRSGDDKVIHIHVDDWNDVNGEGEFGFPIGYSSHEDVAFMTKTTQDRIDQNKVGEEYYLENDLGEVVVNRLASDFGEYGERVRVVRAERSWLDKRDYRRCRAQKSRHRRW
ncbi:MAG: hypothetical protein AAF493_20805 [Pseudomonadota bacterium]